MTTEFPKDPRFSGKGFPTNGKVQFNKDKQQGTSSGPESQADEPEVVVSAPQHRGLSPDQILNHLAATASCQSSMLQQEASLRNFNKLVRVIEEVISKEFPSQNLSPKAQEQLAIGVINRLLDAQNPA